MTSIIELLVAGGMGRNGVLLALGGETGLDRTVSLALRTLATRLFSYIDGLLALGRSRSAAPGWSI